MKTDVKIPVNRYLLAFWRKCKLVFFVLLLSITAIHAQNNNPNPEVNAPQYKGDNFSLEGALALFKKAKSVAQFERLINDQNNNVNNLDLNNDGKTDYISVNDIKENNAHILVLSTYLTNNTTQDIATINIEKSGDQMANVQIIGDPDLYPSNTISEPSAYNGDIATFNNNDNNNRTNSDAQSNQNEVNVWGWPLVQFMYNPYYSVWNSPYYWDYLPVWYSPWRPIYYNTFHVGLNRYHPYFRSVPVVRLNYSRNIYVTRRGTQGYRQNFHNQNITLNFNRSAGKTINRKVSANRTSSPSNNRSGSTTVSVSRKRRR